MQENIRLTSRIWFLPGNTSHLGKNRDLLGQLRDRGHQVRIICIDHYLPPTYASA